MLEAGRDPVAKARFGDDASSKDGVGGRETGANDHCCGGVAAEDEVGEEGGNGPGEGHDGTEEVEDGFPVPFEPELGELDANGEALDADYNTSDFLEDLIVHAPFSGSEDV